MNGGLKTAMASIALLAVSVSSAQAAGTGTITFDGEILEAACSIEPGSVDQTIPLGQVASAQLATGGITNPVFFNIQLTGCTFATTGSAPARTVTATFTGAASTDVTGALAITGTANGAGIMLRTGSGAPITLGTATAAQSLLDGDNTLLFSAHMKGKATGTITPGQFNAVTNFALAYQ